MTQKEKNDTIAWCKAEIERLQNELNVALCTVQNARLNGNRTVHGNLKLSCAAKIRSLHKRLAYIENCSTYEPTVEVAARIQELEHIRDCALAAATDDAQRTSIKRKYNQRIGRLRMHGVEFVQSIPGVAEKSWQTKRERNTVPTHYKRRTTREQTEHDIAKCRASEISKQLYDTPAERRLHTKRLLYGNGAGDPAKLSHKLSKDSMQKLIDTKLKRYGNIYGPNAFEHAKITKLKRYGNMFGDTSKSIQTRLERYGNRSGNIKKSQDTKRKRYGNIWGDADKIRATKLERYGNAAGIDTKLMQQKYGVPFFCMHQKCRNAHKNVISATNKRWQTLLLQELGLAFDCDDVNIERQSYDLHYKHLLIEICPTISHNSTYGYAYAIGKSKHNCPPPFDYHFNKAQLALKHGYTCITVFDWMTPEQVVDIIKQHLDKTIDSTDFCFNPQQSIDKSTIRKHWTKLNSKEHIADIGQDDEQMIADDYVAVYDCGHAKLLADDCGHC